MVLAGCVQSSVWAYGFSKYATYLGAGTTIGPSDGTNGCWSAPTLAPNGLLYCLPTASILDSVDFQKIAVIRPGLPNSASDNYIKSSISFAIADGSPSKPFIPNTDTRRYTNRGILAPNGLIYFIPDSETTILVLDPATGSTDCTWDLKTYASIETDTGVTAGSLPQYSFKGAVLGPDGYIYLIPNRACTLRIAPRNTAVNATASDVYEIGYYNNSAVDRRFKLLSGAITAGSMYYYPKDASAINLTATPNIGLTSASGSRQYVGNVATGVVHPNGKIYMGGGATRWIFILDPANWGTLTEIYSAPNLYLSPSIILTTAYTKDLYLEKPQSVNPVDTANVKILYLTDTYISSPAVPVNPLLSSLVIDPTTNTVSVIGGGNGGANLGNTGSLNGITIQMPNGLFYKTASATASYGKYLFTGPDSPTIKTKEVFRGDSDTFTPGVNSDVFANTMGGYSRSGASVILPGEKSNISIVVGGESGSTLYSGEMVSIKQYSPNTTYFSYTATEAPLYEIPTDLTTLPTSLYNSYCNTIK
jgi:hypothetical protein